MFKFLTASFLHVLAICLSLAGSVSHAQPLIIGGYQYPPFMDEKTKDGLYIQLMKSIQAHTKFEFKWVFYPYARLDHLFHQGKVHLEIGSSPAWNINKPTPGPFTDSFYAIEDVTVYASNQYQHIVGKNTKGSQSIGVVRGYQYPIFDQVLAQQAIKKVERSDEDELLQLLINERIHQVFINQQVFEYLRQQNPEYNQLTMGDVVGHYDVAIRVHPDHADLIPILNQAIKQLKVDGTIERLFKRNQQP